MKIKFLGTAAAEGIPGIFCDCDICKNAIKVKGNEIRTRSSVMFDDYIKFDLPPDTYMHLLQHDIPLHELEHLVFTHSHSDHFAAFELEFIKKGFSVSCKRKGKLNVYCNDKVKREIDSYDGLHEYINIIEMEPFNTYSFGKYKLTPMLASHAKDEKCLIYILDDGKIKLIYGNDTGIYPQQTLDYLKDKHIDLVISDCTCGIESEGSNHLGMPDVCTLRDILIKNNTLNDKSKIITTHVSHNGGLTHVELDKLARSHGFIMAHDGFEYVL